MCTYPKSWFDMTVRSAQKNKLNYVPLMRNIHHHEPWLIFCFKSFYGFFFLFNSNVKSSLLQLYFPATLPSPQHFPRNAEKVSLSKYDEIWWFRKWKFICLQGILYHGLRWRKLRSSHGCREIDPLEFLLNGQLN